MIVLKIVGFGILASLMVVILKENSKEVSIILVIASSIVLLLASINYLTPIVSMVENIVSKTSIDSSYIIVILKVTGIAYLIEFGKDICIDAGQNSIANKMEIAGKIIIASLSVPVITSVFEVVEKLL
ncbi:MAG: stage III sporulation protein AD [Clostridia bacterium]|nr:stage III sporulation protein AD [Clostridia bacterium]